MTTFNKPAVIFFAVMMTLLSTPGYAATHDLGVFGWTYPIAERDAIEELKSRAAAVDWGRVFNSEKMGKAIKDYKPDIRALPNVLENRRRLVDISYSLELDIPDGKGGILYPRGYTFNPLAYVNFSKTLVVINGDDPGQVAWFLTTDYAKAFDTVLLITDGSYYDLGQKIKRPVFYATSQIIDRLQLRAVPSVARQSGKYMEINEIALSKNQ